MPKKLEGIDLDSTDERILNSIWEKKPSKKGMEFDTQTALDSYLEKHPDADKSKHSVKKKAPARGTTNLTIRGEHRHDKAVEMFKRAGISEIPPSKLVDMMGTHMVEGKHDAVVLYRNDFINIEIDNDSMGFSQMRILEIDDAGKLILNNELFKIAPEYQGMGYGTKALFHQVKEAKKAGISYIQTFAAREDGYNGYYTWAQLGYDCDLENIGGHIQQTVKKAVTKGELPEGKYETVQDIMKANGGPEWWKKNGVGFPGDINLEKEGATDRIEAYVKAQADHIGVSVDEWLDMPGEEIVKRKKAKKVEARLIRLAYLYPSLSSLVQS